MGTIITLPSGKQVEISPADGKAERMFEDKKLIRDGTLIDKYLTSRIESVDCNTSMTPQQKEAFVLDLFTGDRNYLLYQIRVDSYGPDMVFNHECPKCKKTNGYKVDLKELLENKTVKIYPYKDEPLRVKLPRSGGYAIVKHATGHDERRAAQIKDDMITGGMLLRTAELNGKPPTRKEMEELIGEDRAVIRGAMEAMNKAGLWPEIELTCLECNSDYQAPLQGIPDFFVPTKMSMETAGA